MVVTISDLFGYFINWVVMLAFGIKQIQSDPDNLAEIYKRKYSKC